MKKDGKNGFLAKHPRAVVGSERDHPGEHGLNVFPCAGKKFSTKRDQKGGPHPMRDGEEGMKCRLMKPA